MTLSASLSIVMGLSRTQRVIYLYFLCFFPTAGRKAVLWQPDIFSPHPKNLQSQGRWVNSRSVCSFSLFQEAVEVNLRKVACKCTHTCTHTCTRARAHTHTHTHTMQELTPSHSLSSPACRMLHFIRFHVAPATFFWLVGWLNETQPSPQTSKPVSSIANSSSSLSSLRLHSNLTRAALHDNQA